MKRSMLTFLKTLVNDDYSILEEIINNKYRKFTELYYILANYSDQINSLYYKVTNKENLKIELKVNGCDLNDLLEKIKESTKGNEAIEITTEKKKIHIKITKDESLLP